MLLTIPGITPSVNHMYKDKWIRGRKYRVLTPVAQAWKDETVRIAQQWRRKTGWFKTDSKTVVCVWFYFPDNRKRDTHNGLKLLMDCLEDAGIYENDRFALPRIMDWEIDRKNPRIELEIYELREAKTS